MEGHGLWLLCGLIGIIGTFLHHVIIDGSSSTNSKFQFFSKILTLRKKLSFFFNDNVQFLLYRITSIYNTGSIFRKVTRFFMSLNDNLRTIVRMQTVCTINKIGLRNCTVRYGTVRYETEIYNFFYYGTVRYSTVPGTILLLVIVIFGYQSTGTVRCMLFSVRYQVQITQYWKDFIRTFVTVPQQVSSNHLEISDFNILWESYVRTYVLLWHSEN